MWFLLAYDVRDRGFKVGGNSCEQNGTGYSHLNQCSSSVVVFACPSCHWTMAGNFWLLYSGGRFPGILLAGVEVRSATEHPRVGRTVPHSKGLSRLKCQWLLKLRYPMVSQELSESISWWPKEIALCFRRAGSSVNKKIYWQLRPLGIVSCHLVSLSKGWWWMPLPAPSAVCSRQLHRGSSSCYSTLDSSVKLPVRCRLPDCLPSSQLLSSSLLEQSMHGTKICAGWLDFLFCQISYIVFLWRFEFSLRGSAEITLFEAKALIGIKTKSTFVMSLRSCCLR